MLSVGLYTTEGNKIAQSTGVDLLLSSDFDLKINDVKYRVEVSEECKFCMGAGSIITFLFIHVHVCKSETPQPSLPDAQQRKVQSSTHMRLSLYMSANTAQAVGLPLLSSLQTCSILLSVY